MLAYLPHPDTSNDYAYIRVNGMWYQEWQSGYHDILKRGYPRPKHKTTILAELYSPTTSDFLHGGSGEVRFLVSPRTREIIRKYRLSGVRFSSVEIAKVATRGRRKAESRSGEPEDVILKAKDKSSDVGVPKLYAARVVGRFEIIPDYLGGRCTRIGWVTPFDLPKSGDMPDLWRPTIRGKAFAGWVYCSQRFRQIVEEFSLSNIEFEPFNEHMSKFRDKVAAGLAESDGLNNESNLKST